MIVVWRLKIVTPHFEGFVAGEQFIVMSVVTKLFTIASAAIKRDRVNSTIFCARAGEKIPAVRIRRRLFLRLEVRLDRNDLESEQS